MATADQRKSVTRLRQRNSRAERPPGIASALGVSRSFAVTSKPSGPFGVAALRDEIQSRLVSRGGRPSDPGPTIRRLVPIKREVWRHLKAQAAFLSSHGKRVSPAQLAAILVEKSVAQLESLERPES
jgi:hypothetical protein